MTKDIAYGPHPRHLLDPYLPAENSAPRDSRRPVLAFFHGGAYTSGDCDVQSGWQDVSRYGR